MPARKRPTVVCPADHAHGATATCRSLHGCSCDHCRDAAARYQRKRYWAQKTRQPLLLDATGTQRRIRALQRVGWSLSVIAKHAGHTEPWVGAILRNRKVRPETARVIRELYDRLAWTPPEPRNAVERAAVAKTRAYAARAGFPSPIDWSDIDRDVEPSGMVA